MPTLLPFHEFGNPQASTVLLLHPGGAMHSIWLPFTRAWESRYHLLAPDLIPTNNGPIALQNLAEQIIALLQERNGRRVWLMGSSLGANVALLVAVNAPQLVAGLVLDSAQAGGPPPPQLPQIIRFLKGFVSVLPASLITALLLSQFTHYTPADKLALRAEITALGKMSFLEQIEAHFDYDVRAKLNGISVPTLILAGEQDQLTKSGAPDKLQAGIPSAVMKIIPNAGHVTFLQQPALFQQAVEAFWVERKARI